MVKNTNSESKCCILFSTADWYEPYWTNKQHTANTLIDFGWKVLYVESIGLRSPSLSCKKDIKRIIRRALGLIYELFIGPKKINDQLYVLSPVVIPGAPKSKFLQSLNRLLLTRAINKHLSYWKSDCSLVWSYHPFLFDSVINDNKKITVYHCVDDLSEFPGVDKNSIINAERDFLKSVDIVFATTKELEKKCSKFNRNTHYLPNVVDFEHFRKNKVLIKVPSDLENIPVPRIIYHGVLSDFKIDFSLLHDVALECPDLSIVLIGGEREGQSSHDLKRLCKLKNVYMLGYKKYNELPNYLHCADLGILPSKINDYTRSMFPMKYFEFIASGLRVVSTRLNFIDSENDALVVAEGTRGFKDMIYLQLSKGPLPPEESIKIVAENTWHRRTEIMLKHVNDMLGDAQQ